MRVAPSERLGKKALQAERTRLAGRARSRVAQTPGFLLLLSLLVFAPPLPATDSSDAQARRTLRGLQGVGVVIERLDAEAEQAGLTRAQLQTVVEERLQQAGIPVLTGDTWTTAPGLPYLALI